MNENFSFTERDEVLEGPFRTPRNSARFAGKGSIHDDDTAHALGFRGGTIAGSLHMEQFVPLMLELFGVDWLRSGGMSLYFKNATTDNEPVRVYARRNKSSSPRAEVWMDDTQGSRVAQGSANIGGLDSESALRQRIAALPQYPRDLRILSGVSIGDSGERIRTRVTEGELDERLLTITESIPAYLDASTYGQRVTTPELQVKLARPGEFGILPSGIDYGVGLFGAIELQMHGGPVFVEHDYETNATVLAVGETPKTEFVFYEAKLFEIGDDSPVMSMVMMMRFMKASSSLWQPPVD